jgi:poly(3-hydroxyalkanoate) synthetase
MAPATWDPFTAAADLMASWTELASRVAGGSREDLPWATSNRLLLETETFRLREFAGTGSHEFPILVLTPFALHGAVLADLAPGHSLVERLCAEGLGNIRLLEWKSATSRGSLRGIDAHLADLCLAIDDLGGSVDLVGLCQGGWLAAMLAARHPVKIRRLVLAGAPIDLDAGPSLLTTQARAGGAALIETWKRWGDGVVSGSLLGAAWQAMTGPMDSREVLQVATCDEALEKRFRAWEAWTFDLPSTYLREVAVTLFIENRLARGAFSARGRAIDLAAVQGPVFALAGRDDTTTPPAQALAAARLIDATQTALAPCGHLSLFMGARTLTDEWIRVAEWLRADEALRRRNRRGT